MKLFIELFITLPFIGFVLLLLVNKKRELILSQIAFGISMIQFVVFQIFCVLWVVEGAESINVRELSLFKTTGYDFFVDFYFDRITAVYMFVGSFLFFLVTRFSRYYMHREWGYKRFFLTIMLFYCGYTAVIYAGNFETLFIGWEILGISSFLLIAFYRERYLPVKNAVKVFSIYRIGDIGLILAMWLSHHLWHENITFQKLQNSVLVHEHLAEHSVVGMLIALLLLVSALAKSAQFPFSSWLPRAMEGPTPSSAIFYGSLSVHMGVFLLLRTYPFWENQIIVRWVIAGFGLITAIVAGRCAGAQPTIKGQIAYASASQIGIMFMEVACGFSTIALIHFAGNAFLRTYQLLVSPSVVAYLIRDQLFSKKISLSLPNLSPWAATDYVLSLKEWNMDSMMFNWLWQPLKKLGNRLAFVNRGALLVAIVPLLLGAVGVYFYRGSLPEDVTHFLPATFAFLALVMVLKAFTERRDVVTAWTLIVFSHLWLAMAVAFNEEFAVQHILIYLSGVVAGGISGYGCLYYLLKKERKFGLSQFYGHVRNHPYLAVVFLFSCGGLSGFPVTPTFIGEDLIFSHIHPEQWLLASLVGTTFMIDGLAVVRIYARVFLGPDARADHEIPYRSA